MKQLHVAVAVVALMWPVSVDAQTLATLRVTSEKTAGGIVTLTLQSGNVIEVLGSDLYGLVKGGLQAPLSQTTPPPPFIAPPIQLPPASTSSGPTQSVNENIRAHCTKEWPADFRMRAYCEGQQNEAVIALGVRLNAGLDHTAEGRTIMATCLKQWGENYRMLNYCVDQQLEGLKALGR